MRGERFFRPFFDRVDAPTAMRAQVLAALTAPTRHWHWLLHHALVLRAVVAAGHDGANTRRLILAALFHDIVYDATRNDNEEASARIAREWLEGDEADAIARLIFATRHHDLAIDAVTRTLLEADLSVLWTTSVRLYAFYAQGIRSEYAHVPDAAYRTGRAAVLRRLREQLSPAIGARRAASLTRNVAGELAALAAGTFDLNR